MFGKKRVKAKESTYGRRDVARDDDFLSDTLLADLVPNCKILVHHAWGHGRHTYDAPVLLEILSIVRKYVVDQIGNSPPKDRVKEALRHFAELEIVKRHLRGKDDRERAPFLTHANRYLQVYLPTSHFEFVPTERYTWHTEKNELAVKATANFEVGKIISGLCGVLVALTNEENEELRGGQDFSIVVNVHTKRFFILLGPARFVNHDCNPNVKMKRDGKSLTFEVIRPIKGGEEILSSYGENYFGEENCECLCETCEQNGTGLFAKEAAPGENGERRSSTLAPRCASSEAPVEMLEFEERKTRRGTVFWRAPAIDDEEEEEEAEEEEDEGADADADPEDDGKVDNEQLQGVETQATITIDVTTKALTNENEGDREVEHRPSSSREVSADLPDGSSIERAQVAVPQLALISPDVTVGRVNVAFLTPEPTPVSGSPQPHHSVNGSTEMPSSSLSVPATASATPESSDSNLSDGKTRHLEASTALLTPPPTSSEGTPASDTVVPDRRPDLPIGFAVIDDDDDMECPYSPLSSALSSALSDVPSDFDIDEAVHDILGDSAGRPSSPVAGPDEVFMRPETPPGDNCAATKCNLLFSEKNQPIGKWCMRCARHFKIFQVEWPYRTGIRRMSPMLPGPPVWSRGRQVVGSPPASRETSVSSQRHKRKAKDVAPEAPKTKKSRLSKVTSVKRGKRTYTRRVAPRSETDSDSGSDSGEVGQHSEMELEAENLALESENEEEQDSEQSEEEIREPVISRPIDGNSGPRRRGRPRKRLLSVPQTSESLKLKITVPRGRPPSISPMDSVRSRSARVPSSTTGRASQATKSITPAEKHRSTSYDRSPISPVPSQLSSPPTSDELRSLSPAHSKAADSLDTVSPWASWRQTGKVKNGPKHLNPMMDGFFSSRGRHIRDNSEGDNDWTLERPSKKQRSFTWKQTPQPEHSQSPPPLAGHRPLLNGLHISPRGGNLFVSPGVPKGGDSFKMMVPQPPLWWTSSSPVRIASDLSAPLGSQRPKWAPPPPPRELASTFVAKPGSPLSSNRSLFTDSTLSSSIFSGRLAGSSRPSFILPPPSPQGNIGVNGLKPLLNLNPSPFGIGIRTSMVSRPAVRDETRNPWHWNVDEKDIIVLDSSDEDDEASTPAKPVPGSPTDSSLTAPPRTSTSSSPKPVTKGTPSPRRTSTSSSPKPVTKGTPSKAPRISGDARLVHDALMSEGMQTRSAKKTSGGKRATKAALGKHRNA